MYITDRINSLVRVYSAGIVATLAGSGSPSYNDGVGTSASFWFPQGIALAADGVLFVAGVCRAWTFAPDPLCVMFNFLAPLQTRGPAAFAAL